MPTNTLTPVIDAKRFGSIDDYLGPAGGRFFGSGYRRVRYRLEGVATLAGGGVRATAGVVYPADWSKKSTIAPLRPHLSTIDALLLAADAIELQLSANDAAGATLASLRTVSIRPGSAPYEAGLECIPVQAMPRFSAANEVSVFDCRVGNMVITCEVDQGAAGAAGAAFSATSEDGTPVRLYGRDYRRGAQRIEQLTIDVAARQAGAVATLEDTHGPAEPRRVSMIDSFVITLQMGQVLLYELDGMERARSNTLWMRRTTIRDADAASHATGPFQVNTALSDAALLRRGGSTWRTATVVGDCNGVETRCAVAHELPS